METQTEAESVIRIDEDLLKQSYDLFNVLPEKVVRSDMLFLGKSLFLIRYPQLSNPTDTISFMLDRFVESYNFRYEEKIVKSKTHIDVLVEDTVRELIKAIERINVKVILDVRKYLSSDTNRATYSIRFYYANQKDQFKLKLVL